MAIQNLLSLGQLNQLKDDRLTWSKHVSLGDEVGQESTDLSGSPCDGDPYGLSVIDHLLSSIKFHTLKT